MKVTVFDHRQGKYTSQSVPEQDGATATVRTIAALLNPPAVVPTAGGDDDAGSSSTVFKAWRAKEWTAVAGADFDRPISELADAGATQLQLMISDPPKFPAVPVAEPSTALVAVSAASTSASASTTTTTYSSYYDSGYYDRRSATGFCGLSNQGATCYMNSLLQSLFMTPEFRRAVYEWDFEEKFARDLAHRLSTPTPTPAAGSPTPASAAAAAAAETPEEYRARRERLSIPLQLQRLFARLQLGKTRAATTTRLTKSFGWTDAEAFQQHDVQELCRVLFDSLEQAMKETHQAQLINELFQGQMRDYVKCMRCGRENARQDAFLDVPLVIKGFGETTAVRSVQEALRKFVAEEKLDGANQYRCEHCQMLCDAVKGLRFVTFPYIVMLQLKRFDFDYETMRRIKLNDRVEFPYTLDLNDFVETSSSLPQEQEGMEPAEESLPPELAPSTQDTEPVPAPAPVPTTAATPAKEDIPKPTKERPYVYELYAVLMHRGNAQGGHYYAYIKDFARNRWFEFNDSTVMEITDADIKKAFGDDPAATTGYSSSYWSSSAWGGSYGANAYMLMYRRIEPGRNLPPVSDEQVPEKLRTLVEAEEAERTQKEEKKRIERETLTVRFFRREGEPPKEKPLHKSTTVAKALEAALELYGLGDGVVPEGCARLRMYSETNAIAMDPLALPNATLEGIGLTSFRSALFLETRKPDADFSAFNPDDVDLTCAMWRGTEGHEWERQKVTLDRKSSLSKLRELLAATFDLSAARLRLFMAKSSPYDPTAYVHLRDETKDLTRLGIGEGVKLFAEDCDDGLAELAAGDQSHAIDEILRLRNVLSLRVVFGKQTTQIAADKRIKFSELKTQLSSLLGLPADQMQVSRGTITWKYEFKETDLTLDDHRMYDGMEIFVDKGRPTRAGEFTVNLHLFEVTPTGGKYRKLLDLPLNEEDPVETVCELISREIAALPTDPVLIPPEQIRLRDMTTPALFPGKVLRRGLRVRDHLYLYTNKQLAIERWTLPEPVASKEDIVLYAQRWRPSTLDFGPVEALVAGQHKPFNLIREILAPQLGDGADPSRVAIAKPAYGGVECLTVPDVFELKWDVVSFADGATTTLYRATLYLRDGDLLVFKDREEKEKDMTPEERAKLLKDADGRRQSSYTSYYAPRKEVALKIDVDAE